MLPKAFPTIVLLNDFYSEIFFYIKDFILSYFIVVVSTPSDYDTTHPFAYPTGLKKHAVISRHVIGLRYLCEILFTIVLWHIRISHRPMLGKPTLTHLPLDKMAAISQTVFSYAFSWIERLVFWFKFQWSLFLRVPLTITQYWYR